MESCFTTSAEQHHSDISCVPTLRTNIYIRRCTNKVTKQFEEVRGRDF